MVAHNEATANFRTNKKKLHTQSSLSRFALFFGQQFTTNCTVQCTTRRLASEYSVVFFRKKIARQKMVKKTELALITL